MDQASLIEKLLLFGLGRQEAGIYLCLLQNEALSGYEVSKLTGISRSNVYNSLASLVEQGAAYLCEGSPSKYIAVGMHEFCDNRIRKLQNAQQFLEQNAPKKEPETEGYVTVEGYDHICDKLHHLLSNAVHRVYLSADSWFVEMWEKEITQLILDGKKVVVISEDTERIFPRNELLRSHVVFYSSYHSNNLPDVEEHKGSEISGEAHLKTQLRLIVDSGYVLTGDITGNASDSCLYSGQKNFVEVFKDAMRNEIELSILKHHN